MLRQKPIAQDVSQAPPHSLRQVAAADSPKTLGYKFRKADGVKVDELNTLTRWFSVAGLSKQRLLAMLMAANCI